MPSPRPLPDDTSPRETVRVDVTPPIATLEVVWRDAPDGHETESWRALFRSVCELAGRPYVKCVVLRQVGGAPEAPAFSGRAITDRGRRAAAAAAALRAVRGSRLPFVALIEGPCTGWALELATCCDLRVCAVSSRLGAAVGGEVLEGVYDEPRPLAQLLGPTPALERVLRGGHLGAERALELGLVNRVAADGTASEQAYGLAARLAAGAPLLNLWHKEIVRRLYGQAPATF